MRTAVLLDTGPIVAFLKRDDQHHVWAIDIFAALRPPLLTCEPVLSEAVYLLRGVTNGGTAALELVRRGILKIEFRLEEEIHAVTALIRKYGSRTMDLADACIVRMAELRSDCRVLTVDGQFRDVYRRHGRQAIPTILPLSRSSRLGSD